MPVPVTGLTDATATMYRDYIPGSSELRTLEQIHAIEAEHVAYAVDRACPPGFPHVLPKLSERLHLGIMNPVARDGSVPGERCDSFVVMQQEGTTDILTGIGPPLTQPGRYRVCIDAAAGNHYPAARAFAQRGGPVDCVRVLAMTVRQMRQLQNQ